MDAMEIMAYRLNEPSKEVEEVTENLSDRLFSEAKMKTYITAYCNAKHFYETKRALEYALAMHEGQFRKKGHSLERIPYIYHPLLLTCHALALGLEDGFVQELSSSDEKYIPTFDLTGVEESAKERK